MRNSTYEIARILNQKDFFVLYNIYLFRCLTIRQIYKNYYIDEISSFEKFYDDKLKQLLELEVVEKVEFNFDNHALFLTSIGIEIVRHQFDLPTNIVDPKKKVIKRGYYRAGELKMFPRLINHQVHLNQFVIDFKKLADKKNLKWKYFDEKYVSQYVNIRPDGLIQLLDTDFFLEMDMSTESQVQLTNKWEHYRSFLNSREYTYKDKSIVVLFIIDNTNNIEKRKDLIRLTASEVLLDIFDSDFDLYIGTKEELLTLLFTKLIPNVQQSNWRQEAILDIIHKNHQFSIANGEKFRKLLCNTQYAYYMRRINENNNIVVDNGKIQEYLFDEYFFRPLSVLKKIAYLQRNSSCFKHHLGRNIEYIVLVEDEEIMYYDLKIVDLIGIKNVYFTTIDRLEKRPFYEALFQYDSLGNVHHFTNNGLKERVFEKNLEA